VRNQSSHDDIFRTHDYVGAKLRRKKSVIYIYRTERR